MAKYNEELKSELIRLHLKEGRTQKSLEEEYNLGKGAIGYMLKQYREECTQNSDKKQESVEYVSFLAIKKENEALKKENEFLKKVATFFAKEA